MGSIVMITGATAGFGKACAEKFAGAGYDLILTGRRKDRLDNEKQNLEKTHGIKVHTLCFDVQDFTATREAIESLPEGWKKIAILINNAGLAAGMAPIDEGALEDWEAMIDTNVKGLLYVSKLVIPLLKTQKGGHIINIGSIAGKEVYANGNVYCASKFAVDALSKAMRIDLLPYGIKVTGLHPGAADTEFSLVRFKGDEARAEKVYQGFTPLYADDIANVAFYCATLPPHVCINDLVITCTDQANATTFLKKPV
jgi:NADP-dependent 3-hydroxy acid dehydrogenase YdfG